MGDDNIAGWQEAADTPRSNASVVAPPPADISDNKAADASSRAFLNANVLPPSVGAADDIWQTGGVTSTQSPRSASARERRQHQPTRRLAFFGKSGQRLAVPSRRAAAKGQH